MRQRSAQATTIDALENVDIECTHCGVTMSGYASQASGLRYFRCGSCHRWVTSGYSDILDAGAKVRAQPRREAKATSTVGAVKERLERWLAALDTQDPYRTLGVSPTDSPDAIRTRYRELAFECHPDRGGSVEKMRELNVAYDRITGHLQRRAGEVQQRLQQVRS